MEPLLTLFLAWGFVAVVLALGFFYLGPSFIVWVAGGLSLVALSPIPLPQLSNPAQMTIWGICISLFFLIWYLFVKPPGTDKSKVRSSIPPKELVVGESGVIIEAADSVKESNEFLVRLQNPVQGATDWKIIAVGEINPGDQVVVVDLVGKSLVVQKPETNW